MNFELKEPWQIYAFSKICKDLGIGYHYLFSALERKDGVGSWSTVIGVIEDDSNVNDVKEIWEDLNKERTVGEYIDNCFMRSIVRTAESIDRHNRFRGTNHKNPYLKFMKNEEYLCIYDMIFRDKEIP
jgi:hypothetical protein